MAGIWTKIIEKTTYTGPLRSIWLLMLSEKPISTAFYFVKIGMPRWLNKENIIINAYFGAKTGQEKGLPVLLV